MLKNIYAKIVQAKNPIQIPYQLVEKIVDWVESVYFESMRESDNPRYHEMSRGKVFDGYCNDRRVFKLDLPNKESVVLTVNTEGRPSKQGSPCAGAHQVTGYDGNPEIVLFLCRTTKEAASKLRETLYRNVSHEVTHAVDSILNPNFSREIRTDNDKYKEYKNQQEYYYNMDFEVNAYGRNVYDAVKKRIYSLILTSLNRGNSLEKMQQHKNNTFHGVYDYVKMENPEVYKHVNEANRRKLDQLAFRGFEEGFDEAVEKMSKYQNAS